jgi:uncharacterized protein (TIGR02284 family)
METTEEKNKKIISTLNDLVEINNDRVQGYERAISETEDSDLSNIFATMANRSKSYRTILGTEIISLGGQPTEGTKTTGKLFRAWMDIKSALTGKDKKEILNSCETGENAAIDTYKDILENKENNLSEKLIHMIKLQKSEIENDHDRIKTLRDYSKHL